MIPCECVLRHFHMCTPTVNRLCVSRDVNKMHMAEGCVPDLLQSIEACCEISISQAK